jgi:hypothetical protein
MACLDAHLYEIEYTYWHSQLSKVTTYLIFYFLSSFTLNYSFFTFFFLIIGPYFLVFAESY